MQPSRSISRNPLSPRTGARRRRHSSRSSLRSGLTPNSSVDSVSSVLCPRSKRCLVVFGSSAFDSLPWAPPSFAFSIGGAPVRVGVQQRAQPGQLSDSHCSIALRKICDGMVPLFVKVPGGPAISPRTPLDMALFHYGDLTPQTFLIPELPGVG